MTIAEPLALHGYTISRHPLSCGYILGFSLVVDWTNTSGGKTTLFITYCGCSCCAR